MKEAFTTIELIFIIVIIGILSAIAIPKLSSSRNDADASKIVLALSTCINDAGNEYIIRASFHNKTQVGEDNVTVSCRLASRCFIFDEDDDNASLTVDENSSEDSSICKVAKDIAKKNLLTDSHKFYF